MRLSVIKLMCFQLWDLLFLLWVCSPITTDHIPTRERILFLLKTHTALGRTWLWKCSLGEGMSLSGRRVSRSHSQVWLKLCLTLMFVWPLWPHCDLTVTCTWWSCWPWLDQVRKLNHTLQFDLKTMNDGKHTKLLFVQRVLRLASR